jgi:serine/threonine protein kinase
VFRLFHGSGWVHRDISVGNVYLHEGRGVLGDLEFAKNTAGQSQHELRTVRVIYFLSVTST